MIWTLFLFAASFSADFPGGSGRAEWVRPDYLRLHVEGEADQDGRNRQANWYYFRLDDVKGEELTIELTDLVGEYNYQAGTHGVTENTHPVYSYDNRTWRHFAETEWNEEAVELRLRLTPEQETLWIAHVPPYTLGNLKKLEAEALEHPHFQEKSVGRTADSREMPLWTITDAASPDDQKKCVWLMFRQHSWESGSSWAGDGAVRFLLSDSPIAERMRREVVWKIFPMADPDGVERGGVRFNKYGYDLNRNWDAVDPAKTPEIAAQRRAAADWLASGRSIDLFLTLHNTETSEYLEGPAEFHDLTARFRRNLVENTTFAPTRAEPRDATTSTTPGRPGRMTVNQDLHADFGVPAMIMEQMIGRNPKLEGFPTAEDRREFGAGLVQAAWRTVVEQ